MIKAISVGVKLSNVTFDKFNSEMNELTELCKACDIEIVDSIYQELDSFNSEFYCGSGKVSEIKDKSLENEASIIVFNDELTPSQISHLDEAIGITIYDRTYLILEIFKQRSKTKESILQVELASILYMKPRLQALMNGFDRQGGGGGGLHSKGEGETKLDLKKRLTNDRIHALKIELEKLKKVRQTQRKTRHNNEIKNVCLVGYTNSGKSTLLNTFLKMSKDYTKEKEVFSKNMLFATLETKARQVTLNQNRFVLTDTVGFIEKLPHSLIEAFKSTLEEVSQADLLLHVIDISNPDYLNQMEITSSVLKELKADNIPTINVFNKIDLVNQSYVKNEYFDSIRISAKIILTLNIYIK